MHGERSRHPLLQPSSFRSTYSVVSLTLGSFVLSATSGVLVCLLLFRARCIRMRWMHRTPRVMHDARPPSCLLPIHSALSTLLSAAGWRGAKRIVRIFRRPSECREASTRLRLFRSSPLFHSRHHISLLIILPSLLRTLHRLHCSLRLPRAPLPPPSVRGIHRESTKCKPLAPFPTTAGSLQREPDARFGGGLTC